MLKKTPVDDYPPTVRYNQGQTQYSKRFTLPKSRLEILSDCAEEAHARIQNDFLTINPIVGLHKGMRDIGFPADTMTIDCLKTQRRIILILHDEQPDILSYQFAYRDKDPSDQFEAIAFEEICTQLLYDWIADYFSTPDR